MLETVDMIKEAYRNYSGIGMYPAVFLLSLLYLSIQKEKEGKLIVFSSGLFILIIGNPVLVYALRMFFYKGENYQYVFWLFPITVAIAYAVTNVILQQKKQYMKLLLSITLCFLLFLSGNFVYHTSNLFYMDYKNYMMQDRVVELCDALDQKASIKMMAPAEVILYVRKYDANLKQLYYYSDFPEYLTEEEMENQERINIAYDSMFSESPDLALITEIAKEFGCNTIVFSINNQKDQEMQQYGFVKTMETKDYVIYQLS